VYGQLASSAGSPTLLGYAGELTDPNWLEYLRARWYDPVAGAFMSRDPLAGRPEDPSSLNGFVYAARRPTSFTDPSGLDPSSSSNFAYAIAGVFADLDSSDRGTQFRAALKLAVPSVLVAIPLGLAAAPAIAGGGTALATSGSATLATGSALTFGTGHAARHLSGLQVSASEVENAIAAEIQSLRATATVGSEWWGWITVNSQAFQYRALVRPNGVTNVGTYFPVSGLLTNR
jgi:RHS repeat-associated protein